MGALWDRLSGRPPSERPAPDPSLGDERTGRFRVTFTFLTRPSGAPLTSDEYRVPIGVVGHLFETIEGQGTVITRVQPVVTNRAPYDGSLTEHELDWLLSLPGTEYNLCYRFAVEPLDEAARARVAARRPEDA